uniref:DNA repair protein complementing XP-C cells isoform X2 n=1 Tax=Pristiophorus japonicus TaxID=55135 RepID=UPI00398F2F5C
MGKRKGSGQATAHSGSKEGSTTKRAKGGPAKAAKQQLLPDDISQDFEPEKPPSRLAVRRKGAAKAQVTPRGNHAARRNPSKAGGRRGSPSVKAEDGEGIKRSAAGTGSLTGRLKQEEESSEDEAGTEDSENEWEEVEELQNSVSEESLTLPLPKHDFPEEPLEIEIETPAYSKKKARREKRQAEFEDYLRRMINRFTRNVLVDTHKVHLLCLLANGMFRNRMCNEPELRAVALSLVPAELTKVPSSCVDIPFLSKLLKWFVSAFEIDPSLPKGERENLFTVLAHRFSSCSARSMEEMVHLFLIILRTLPLASRLVISLQPISFKESSKATPRGSKSKVGSRKTLRAMPDIKPDPASRESAKGGALVKREEEQGHWVKIQAEDEDKPQQASKRKQAEGTNKPRNPRGRSKNVKTLNGASAESEFEEDESSAPRKPASPRPKNERRRRVASKVSYKEEDTEEDDDSDSDFQVEGSADSSNHSGGDNRSARDRVVPSRAQTPRGRQTIPGKSKGAIVGTPKGKKGPEDSEDENFEKTNPRKRKSSRCNQTEGGDESARLSIEASPYPKGSDQWIEVYAEAERKWVAIDCVRNTLNHPELCAKHATKPLSYIISLDNQSSVRDVTQRYDAAWMTTTRKRRTDPGWWDKTLEPYKSSCTQRQKEEDLELQAKLLDRPLPTSVAEYKSHPLYVLKRHLLKYETLYPPTASVLGYCRKEAVYSRDCVHTLHSKDLWLKEARVVRDGEVPCKMVKSQSNRARQARLDDWADPDKADLGLFGRWQTEPYQPPRAIDGKVPRNDFGNVYMFRPCMLPRGCKHLRVPNINRVARKLNIDCAGAVIGFDYHSGHSHPVIDGYIVCDEHEEILLAAHEEDEAETARKEQMKRQKRAMGNWKLLVKGLFIRERLKTRYSMKDGAGLGESRELGGGCSSGEEGPSDPAPASDLASSWPLNRQTAETAGPGSSQRRRKGEEKHLFPFEKL